MEIQFVGHASFIIHAQEKRIIADPWLSGKVFNDSWALISPAAAVDWSSIDYLWVSHEHPDHFHFPTLKSIPDNDKKRIIVLHQRHASERMVEALKKIGFGKVLELPLYKWVSLESGIEAYCGSVGSMDSFLAIRSEGKCVLNLNDCVLNTRQIRYIKSSLGRIDALFTQFSFANWVGNDQDEINGATNKIRQIKEQLAILKPDHVVPFASYVYFCNQENQRMNAWINTPQTIQNLGIPQIHFMYPGDTWNLQKDGDASARAVARYSEDYRGEKIIDPMPKTVDEARLKSAAESCMDKFVQRYPFRASRMSALTIYIKDLNKLITFDPSAKSVALEDAGPDTPARLEMCSQAAWFMFNFPWGGGTLEVSGMFRDYQRISDGPHPFFNLQNRMSTQVLDLGGFAQTWRTLHFLWRKKWEISYRYMERLNYLST